MKLRISKPLAKDFDPEKYILDEGLQRLAEAGFGRWPQGELVEPPAGFDPWLAMAAIGYPLNDRAAAVRAFHRHYRGRDDGEDPQAAFDAEDLRILHALATQLLQSAPR